jgi:hypothetical protein
MQEFRVVLVAAPPRLLRLLRAGGGARLGVAGRAGVYNAFFITMNLRSSRFGMPMRGFP